MSNDIRRGRHDSGTHEGQDNRIDSSRRTFTKAGLVATPVILSLTSRPVLGNQCSLSGMLSTTYSGPETIGDCAGRTPGFWMTHPDLWPGYTTPGGAYVYPGKIVCAPPPNKLDGNNLKVQWNRSLATTLFSDVFGLGLRDDITMMNLMWDGGSNDPYQLGAHACAAWFNAHRTEFNYGLTPQDVVDRVTSVVNGTYPGNALPQSEGLPLEEQLKLEFQYLNERGSIDLDTNYDFLLNADYWIDQETYDLWLSGEGANCKSGTTFTS